MIPVRTSLWLGLYIVSEELYSDIVIINILYVFYFRDYYLTSAGWIGHSNTQVSAVWMNRAQNFSVVSACMAPNWTCIEVGESFTKNMHTKPKMLHAKGVKETQHFSF